MDNNFIEAQRVIDHLLDQVKQLSLTNAMLMAKIDQVLGEKQGQELALKE
ncbi:MAG TPA: hypothetical protein GX526_04580 [Thermoanaerobacterales bacterium]|nr:hypothetical protein [Thermoanaerobacterales bacterium]